VKVRVLDVDVEKERISLGIKQLGEDPFAQVGTLKRGDIVTCTVAAVQDNGIEVSVAGGLKSFIRKSDLSRDRSEQRPERFAVGDKVDAQVTSFDKTQRRLGLSVKAREIHEEKEAVAQYGSTDSGASLGDILGAAISRARRDAEARGEGEAEAAADDEPEAAEAEAGAETEEAGEDKEA